MVDGMIYFLLNKISGKMYVGQTTNLRKRINEHKRGDQYVDRAIKKYGWKSFRCSVIKTCASKDEMDTWEKFFIILLNTKSPNGYNLTDGGEGIVGLKRTPEHCSKISIAKKGKFFSPEHCANISSGKKGTTLSFEHRAKIGTTLKGIPKTFEHCAHISSGKRANSPYKNLTTEIDAHYLSYKRLAKFLSLLSQNISRKMLGQRNFTAKDKAKLTEIFNKPIEYLMYKEEILWLKFILSRDALGATR